MNVLASQAVLVVFVIGYLCIALEHKLGVNKAASALGMAAVMWALLLLEAAEERPVLAALTEHLAEASQVIFFLLGAMALVEVIDAHQGFRFLTERIRVRSTRGLLCVLGLLAFFMSSVLDNLTTTIVMVALLRHMLPDREQRLRFGGFIVIAANAGGAWTPIGDVTTTMLWIGGQITSLGVMKSLLLPSLACLFGAMAVLALGLPRKSKRVVSSSAAMSTMSAMRESNARRPSERAQPRRGARSVLILGVLAFLFVPVLKSSAHLPPFLGICVGLAAMWCVTDLLHAKSPKDAALRVPAALARIDIASAFFFLGILLAVAALQTAGQLSGLAQALSSFSSSEHVINGLLGVLSAVVDNVPLVAAIMKMYPLTQYPTDAEFWQLAAYCAGTGGSLLSIGSAAGVALMGMEQVSFGYYLRRVTPAAAAGYLLGLLVTLIV